MTDEQLIENIEAYLKDNFSENDFRFKHIFNVKKVAISLAKIHNVDLVDVIVASLLHDATKHFTLELNEEILLSHISNLDSDKFPEGCIHALTAEIVAMDRFKIKNKDILNSIRYHCTGRKEMSKLEKVIFINDYIEESRTFVTEELRNLAKRNLDEAVLQIMIDTKAYLEKNGEQVSSLTEAAIEYYKTVIGGF